jgi:hypothetical protein
MNWLRLREAVPQSADEWLLMAAALVLVLVMLMALLAGAATPPRYSIARWMMPSAIISFEASLTVHDGWAGTAGRRGEEVGPHPLRRGGSWTAPQVRRVVDQYAR